MKGIQIAFVVQKLWQFFWTGKFCLLVEGLQSAGLPRLVFILSSVPESVPFFKTEYQIHYCLLHTFLLYSVMLLSATILQISPPQAIYVCSVVPPGSYLGWIYLLSREEEEQIEEGLEIQALDMVKKCKLLVELGRSQEQTDTT